MRYLTARWSFEFRFWNRFDGDPAGAFVNDTTVSHGEIYLLDEYGHAAGRSWISDQIVASAPTRWSISTSLCSGDGVMRSRSVPRGTVG
jgi:hypothetical protein